MFDNTPLALTRRVNLRMRFINPDELTQVSDSGDKFVWNKFERRMRRPRKR